MRKCRSSSAAVPLVLPLAVVLLSAGCADSTRVPPATAASDAYPKEAAAVTSDPTYKLAFFSGLTGVSYYVRRLGRDEAAAMPKEYVVSDENTSVLVVPIKDGRIVETAPSDRGTAFFSRTPDKMLE